ncbi:hypothetical protein GIB67_010174 [Kingdonia uniflora]|uniref:Potassium channel domain-containing protein n=1 Tax=Kingdonia uniflora TaxID=39325 RepID=A0A7J7NAX5_9MAGN|nr:hypothetical protein GIB67_010174 [Kingdonia uniflora]
MSKISGNIPHGKPRRNCPLNVIRKVFAFDKNSIGRSSAKKYIVDVEKGRMRIRMKVGLALGVVISCIETEILALYSVEGLNLVYSIYLSVMSIATVGYGDRAFHTLSGRLLVSVWILFSTLVIAWAFLYLMESRIDKRHRRIMPQWYRLSDHNGNGDKVKRELMLAVWMGSQADEVFPEVWHSDTAGVSGDGVASIRSKVYLSPKLWHL